MKKTNRLPHRLRYRLFNPGNVKIPNRAEVPIFLIIHELKIHMVYRALKPFATIDAYLEVGLHKLILRELNLLGGKDETYEFYFKLIDKWTDTFSSDPSVITKRALSVYNTLLKTRGAHRRHLSK